jgi:PelA/Pel-15E family pectate lyase
MMTTKRRSLFAAPDAAPRVQEGRPDAALVRQAADALRKAATFYAKQVAAHGGYVYRYSADLAKREGEGKTGPDTVWVQPPGTPAVGLAFLDAYGYTGEAYLLEAARAAGECLIRGQLRSGGWTDSIQFAPDERKRFAYRVDPPRGERAFNVTTFDDDKTQSAMRFLMRLDKATDFKDARVHEAITFALDAVRKAQYPNGAWAQGFSEPPDPAKSPVKPARYPDTWPREYPGGRYWNYYTFNDNTVADTIETLLLAAEIYNDARYRETVRKAGEFILLARMPDPQPAWAQQYDFEMQPVWARKFEPPAISGSESQGLIQILLRLYAETGDKRFLEPVPSALAYLRRSRLPDGRLARFYELRTNKPLYFTRQYVLTYDDSDVPTHYSFKVGSGRLNVLEREYQELTRLSPKELADRRERAKRTTLQLPSDSEVRAVIAGLDGRGAWVEDGRLRYHGPNDDTRRVIESATFIKNIGLLSRYAGRTR